MIILTGANKDIAKDPDGNVYKKFSFRDVINNTIEQAKRYGYKVEVYDLGKLGMGKEFHVLDETFDKTGFYAAEPKKGYKSRSLFKPQMVLDCISNNNEFTVYLDGDATLNDNIDEIETNDYDIGVTVRKHSELDDEWWKEYKDVVGYVNAGVIFFNPSDSTIQFIKNWDRLTHEVGNDQLALNKLVCGSNAPVPYSIVNKNDVRIKYFPCEKYNYYYFDEEYNNEIRIYHFKGMVRNFFPFTWYKQLYCKYALPIKNVLRFFKRKYLSK